MITKFIISHQLNIYALHREHHRTPTYLKLIISVRCRVAKRNMEKRKIQGEMRN